MNPANDRSNEQLTVRVPADVDAPDKVAYGLTFRQLAILAAVSLIAGDGFHVIPDEPVPVLTAASADADLLVVEGDNPGARAELADAPLLIGRGSDAAIRLDDDYVSTRHARIAASGDQWFVEDLGSTNGTYIGTVRITQPTTITLGTQVRIGKTILELRK